MNSGLKACAGAWATASAAAWASWLLAPTTKFSNVLRGLRVPALGPFSSKRPARRGAARSRLWCAGAVAGKRGGGAGTAGHSAVANLQRDIDQPAGGQAEALSDEIQVVIVDPDRREVIGYTERHRILGRFEANDGFKPHLENVLGEEPLEVTFDGFPQAGRESQRRHGAGKRRRLFTRSPSRLKPRVLQGQFACSLAGKRHVRSQRCEVQVKQNDNCLLYTSPSPRDR